VSGAQCQLRKLAALHEAYYLSLKDGDAVLLGQEVGCGQSTNARADHSNAALLVACFTVWPFLRFRSSHFCVMLELLPHTLQSSQ
jgi:hypothetical protein